MVSKADPPRAASSEHTTGEINDRNRIDAITMTSKNDASADRGPTAAVPNKNRRGAGHRGGRGRAGRSKHEFHNYEPKGNTASSDPDIRETVAEIDVQKLDGTRSSMSRRTSPRRPTTIYELDARDIVEDGHRSTSSKIPPDRGRSATS